MRAAAEIDWQWANFEDVKMDFVTRSGEVITMTPASMLDWIGEIEEGQQAGRDGWDWFMDTFTKETQRSFLKTLGGVLAAAYALRKMERRKPEEETTVDETDPPL